MVSQERKCVGEGERFHGESGNSSKLRKFYDHPAGGDQASVSRDGVTASARGELRLT